MVCELISSARISITGAESEVLQALWRHGPLTPPRLLAEIKLRKDWSDSTIKTLLARLIRKKAVMSGRLNGRLSYRPLLSRDDWSTGLVDELVGLAFEGDHQRLALFLAKRDDST